MQEIIPNNTKKYCNGGGGKKVVTTPKLELLFLFVTLEKDVRACVFRKD